MTGSVPYYGGRFTPAQAYAAAHPQQPPARSAPPPPPSQPPSQPPSEPPAPPPSRGDQVAALQDLLDAAVLTQEEFDELRARVEQ